MAWVCLKEGPLVAGGSVSALVDDAKCKWHLQLRIVRSINSKRRSSQRSRGNSSQPTRGSSSLPKLGPLWSCSDSCSQNRYTASSHLVMPVGALFPLNLDISLST